jgi:FlaA1/EpsC-like NDP-sugar epimerase
LLHKILHYLTQLNRGTKQFIQLFSDIIFFICSFICALYIQNDTIILFKDLRILYVLATAIIVNLITFYALGLYKEVIRHISTESIKHVGAGVFFSALCMLMLAQLYEIGLTTNTIFVFGLILFLLELGARVTMRQIYLNNTKNRTKSVAIYGAGSAGRQILNSISKSTDYNPKMFIDDSDNLIGRRISNLNVYSMSQAENLFVKYDIDVLLIAIPRIPLNIKNKILSQLQKYPMQIKAMPSIKDLIEGPLQIDHLRSLSINDLLGRNIVEPDSKLMAKNIKNQVVLITGAGGSIGAELSRQALKCMPKKLILLDISEAALFLIQQEINRLKTDKSIEIISIVSSVQNSFQMLKILQKCKVQTIFHAAAYKHVPLVEANIIEAIKNNIFGTKSIAEMALKARVKNFILVSSDKAVRPTNFMGATKRFSELICQDLALKNTTNFSMVRFGNVLGSSGSVIPHFQKQIDRGGPVTVTDKNITRFFMTMPEAAQLVLQASAMSNGKDIFILDMGAPVKIIDLAFKMIHLQGLKPYLENSLDDSTGDIAVSITGLRPGEKLFEELLLGKESMKTAHPKIFKEKLSGINTSELDKLKNLLWLACEKGDLEIIKNVFNHPEIELNHSGIITDQII